MHPSISAIVFDMDGVMVDTEPLYWQVARQMAERRGARVSDDTLRSMMGRSRLEAIGIFARACGIVSEAPEALLREREDLLAELYAGGVSAMPGLHAMLQRFRGRVKLGVATSSARRFTNILLPGIGVDCFLDVIQPGDRIVHGKPDPEIYLKTMAQLGVESQQTVVIEDSFAGAIAAKRAGAIVIAAPTQLTADQDFSFADARVGSLFEAIEWIETRMGKD
jgi:HAD superfamily hydrolase (TIGR01509 family)